MKTTLLLLSLVAIALISQTQAFGKQPRACKAGEMWNMCSAHCEGTCDLPHPRCTRGCMNPGCKCKYGYVRDERTNKCIPLESCPREKQIFDEMDDEDDEYDEYDEKTMRK